MPVMSPISELVMSQTLGPVMLQMLGPLMSQMSRGINVTDTGPVMPLLLGLIMSHMFGAVMPEISNPVHHAWLRSYVTSWFGSVEQMRWTVHFLGHNKKSKLVLPHFRRMPLFQNLYHRHLPAEGDYQPINQPLTRCSWMHTWYYVKTWNETSLSWSGPVTSYCSLVFLIKFVGVFFAWLWVSLFLLLIISVPLEWC